MILSADYYLMVRDRNYITYCLHRGEVDRAWWGGHSCCLWRGSSPLNPRPLKNFPPGQQSSYISISVYNECMKQERFRLIIIYQYSTNFFSFCLCNHT